MPKFLAAASRALSLLTNSPNADGNRDSTSSDPVEARKEAFVSEASTYFSLVMSVANRLKEQADELVKAGIVPQFAPSGADLAALSNFDVGWLNARVRDVGAGKEAELWKEMRELLEKKGAE